MVCTDAVIIASQRVSVRISDVASYAATLNWKLYLLMAPTSAYTTVWDNGFTQYNSSFNSTLRATALCTADTSNFISVASSNVTDIQLNNTFILMADSSPLALAELLIVYSKCSHKTCRRCSSATNCTLCFDATLFKQLGSCVTACSSQYYTFTDDEVGMRVVDALIDRAKAGLEVKLMADAVGSRRLSKKSGKRMEEAGVQFESLF